MGRDVPVALSCSVGADPLIESRSKVSKFQTSKTPTKSQVRITKFRQPACFGFHLEAVRGGKLELFVGIALKSRKAHAFRYKFPAI
jgi:hypothetical protein